MRAQLGEFELATGGGVWVAARAQLAKHNVDFVKRVSKEPLTSSESASIYADSDARTAVRYYLNVFEDYALAVKVGVVDEALGHAQMSVLVISRAVFFDALIMLMRTDQKEDEIYCELTMLGSMWKNETDEVTQIRDQILEEAKAAAARAHEEVLNRAAPKTKNPVKYGQN